MAKKNVYFYKVVLLRTVQQKEVPVGEFKRIFKEIFEKNAENNSLRLSNDNNDRVILDIIEDTEEYLFIRLSKKKPSFSLQKRDYKTFEVLDVLQNSEIENRGVESFTYGILGYKHGILSIVNVKGAPNDGALNGLFTLYNDNFSIENEAIPNPKTLDDLKEGSNPMINRIEFSMVQPSAEFLEKILGWNEKKILEEMSKNSSILSFELRPESRQPLFSDAKNIADLIKTLKKYKKKYSSVKITGKSNANESQREYDLYEECFKFEMNIQEYYTENGIKHERNKTKLLDDYRNGMKKLYDENKDLLCAIAERL